MSAAKQFNHAFAQKSLKQLYHDKIQHRASIGMDNISPELFESNLDENICLISKKVLDGSYHFTRYREILISKGRNKAPRVISIPTVRDKLALSAYHHFLQNTFSDVIDEPLLHTTISEIAQDIDSGNYDGFVKADITRFYSTINHAVLLKKIRKKVRKKEALSFLVNAITTETISRSTVPAKRSCVTVGVPEGLSISNILADIYLSDLKETVCNSYVDIKFYRYVDDILILCDANRAEQIKDYLVNTLDKTYELKTNQDKTTHGELKTGVPFLGYVFYDSKIGVRMAACHRIEVSLEDLFRKHTSISEELFIWRLNLRIAGCIFNKKKYGWLFYYSQINDLKMLFHLDWYVDHLFSRFNVCRPDGVKSFVRSYHEITKNVSNSTYLINANNYSDEEKLEIVASIFKNAKISELNAKQIEDAFEKIMFREIQNLERDIQNFS